MLVRLRIIDATYRSLALLVTLQATRTFRSAPVPSTRSRSLRGSIPLDLRIQVEKRIDAELQLLLDLFFRPFDNVARNRTSRPLVSFTVASPTSSISSDGRRRIPYTNVSFAMRTILSPPRLAPCRLRISRIPFPLVRIRKAARRPLHRFCPPRNLHSSHDR